MRPFVQSRRRPVDFCETFRSWRVARSKFIQALVDAAYADEQNSLGYQKSHECLDATAQTRLGGFVGIHGRTTIINEFGIQHSPLQRWALLAPDQPAQACATAA
jgi:hypothetical protein